MDMKAFHASITVEMFILTCLVLIKGVRVIKVCSSCELSSVFGLKTQRLNGAYLKGFTCYSKWKADSSEIVLNIKKHIP